MIRSVRLCPNQSTRLCQGDDSFMNTCDDFLPCPATSTLLQNSSRFVPVPLNAKFHSDISDGVEDFLRKYLWTFVHFKNSAAPRFLSRSSRYPPPSIIPRHALTLCDKIRKRVASMLSHCKCCFPDDNLSSAERDELSRLSSSEHFVVSPVDKGSGWMIVPRQHYEAEAFRQLCDTNFYQSLDKSSDFYVSKRLKVLLSHLHKSGFLSTREERALQPPMSSRPRNFYLLPKLHKKSWHYSSMPPGRPIVSDTSSVSRGCADLLEFFLAPIARSCKSFVRDSTHVISLLSNVKVSDASLLATFDIVSLYTNIPTEDGIAAVSRAFLKFPDPRRPDLTLLTMLRLLLKSNCFYFQKELFLQLQGTAMGCAFGSSYANIFLADWEERVFQFQEQPVFWVRFIDDIFLIWESSLPSLLSFQDHINSIFPSITVELTSSLSSIRFLDLVLYKSSGRLLFRVGFKETDTHAILPSSSFHPPHVFKSILFGEVFRWATHSATHQDFLDTKKIVEPCWRRLGYSRSAIRNTRLG